MTDDEFDKALVSGAFTLAGRQGWRAVSVVSAGREAGLALDRARTRFAGIHQVLMKFGEQADAAALADALETGPVRERVFDVLMRRFDALQTHRAGVQALLRHLPADPALALMLTTATSASMAWMAEASGLPSGGLRGALTVQGLVGVWLYTLRAWQADTSADLSGTMAALDRALSRAERVLHLTWQGAVVSPEPDVGPKPFPDPEADMTGPSDLPVEPDPGL